ncbi:MAG TPA: S6e family ribosomal protein [Candidatus Nanoarchaeia archaeon]|nr:S6e family ribosomal protein [Candidatus Nanoarchaeia archaeon]
MVEIKCVINDVKEGKSYNKVSPDSNFTGRKIGDKMPGDLMGFEGYEFQITGGSDLAGFPMRKDIDGMGRKKPLIRASTGSREKDVALRKTVVGNTVGANTAQVNLKITKYGAKAAAECAGPQEKKAE